METPARRYHQLNVYRGVAALLIVIAHAYAYPTAVTGHPLPDAAWWQALLANLDTGVPLFFVLSGFVIFLPFARAIVAGVRAISPGRFLWRRALRILPAYYAATLVVAALGNPGRPASATVPDLARDLTLTHVYSAAHFYGTVGPGWSLGVEAAFYLALAAFAPLAAVACRGGATPRQRAVRLALLVGLAGACSTGYKLLLLAAGLPDNSATLAWYHGPAAQADVFALGMLLAVAAALPVAPTIGGSGCAALRLGALAAFPLLCEARWGQVWGQPLFSLGAGLLAVALLAPVILRDGATARPVWRPLAWLGFLSYSVYLWHQPILFLLGAYGRGIRAESAALVPNAVVAVLATLPIAALSYAAIERPALRLRDWSPFARIPALHRRHPIPPAGPRYAPLLTSQNSAERPVLAGMVSDPPED